MKKDQVIKHTHLKPPDKPPTNYQNIKYHTYKGFFRLSVNRRGLFFYVQGWEGGNIDYIFFCIHY